MTLTGQIAVFLGATVLAVPLFRRLKLSSILAYLAAGVAIGPFGLAVIDDIEGVMHLAEFGVDSPVDFPTNTGLRLLSGSAERAVPGAFVHLRVGWGPLGQTAPCRVVYCLERPVAATMSAVVNGSGRPSGSRPSRSDGPSIRIARRTDTSRRSTRRHVLG